MTTFFNKLTTNSKRRLIKSLMLLIPGIVSEILIHSGLIHNSGLVKALLRINSAYFVIICIIILNSLLLGFLESYSKSEKNKYRPLKGMIQAMQVISIFVGGIIVTSILIDKSPTALLTGLSASAAVLMLIFKDSILGLVAGVQLSKNNMIRIGDWIEMPDGSANGTVEEISLNTVKVRNWDNTISTIPPYTLISSPFKNWRGMQESGGRRVDKMIYIDIRSIDAPEPERMPNSQNYRAFIERYLREHPMVAQDLDIIVAQRQAGQFGLPIEVYFFIKEKGWAEYERIQSDIFDYLISMAPSFGLRLYQLA